MSFIKDTLFGSDSNNVKIEDRYIITLEQLVRSKDTIIEQQKQVIDQQAATIAQLRNPVNTLERPTKRRRKVVDYAKMDDEGLGPTNNEAVPWTVLIRQYNPEYPSSSAGPHSAFVAKYFQDRSLSDRVRSGPTKNPTRAVPKRFHADFITAFTNRYPQYRVTKEDVGDRMA